MKIKEPSKSNNVANVKQIKKVKAVGKAILADKVALSREAKELSNSANNFTPERIAEITKRIEENFYDREDVLQIVAERILRSPGLQKLIKGGRLDKNI